MSLQKQPPYVLWVGVNFFNNKDKIYIYGVRQGLYNKYKSELDELKREMVGIVNQGGTPQCVTITQLYKDPPKLNFIYRPLLDISMNATFYFNNEKKTANIAQD